MAEAPAGEKTLPATPKKIQDARDKGNVAKSQDLNSAVTLIVALLVLWAMGPFMIDRLAVLTRYYFTDAHAFLTPDMDMQHIAFQALMFAVPVVAPMMVVLLVGGVLGNVAQFGFLFSSQALMPKPERLNPISGFQRFVSIRSLVELIKSISKLSLFSLIAWLSVRARGPEILSMMHLSPQESSVALWNLLLLIWLRIALAMLMIGLLDYFYQRWQHAKDLMMTQHEAREELKQLEGDPKIRQRVRQIQREMAMQRMMADVPEADVVITNPTTFAVALRYDLATMDTPIVLAKGARRMAERIRDVAMEAQVPIIERPELARSLFSAIEVGQPVPEHLFRAVAEVLAFVYEIDRREQKVREREAHRVAPVPVPAG
ncbi:MAG: flagellar biosynthesis protein FlhB [Candidatus Hydrogenedentes bacterium]|nr:flagellar biosynthesis protein FlhB [Candidatus Hydrogenedentota bacterium]